MRLSQSTTVICPRCGANVSTEYKYCPECAFRLRAGVEPVQAVPTPAPVWPHILLLLGALALTGAFVLAYNIVFPDSDPPEEEAPETPTARIRVDDLPGELVRLREGVADLEPAREANGDMQLDNGEIVYLRVHTAKMHMSRYETSCGQWAEFLEHLDAQAETEPDPLARYDGPVRHLFEPFASAEESVEAPGDPFHAPGDWTASIDQTLRAMTEELKAAEWAQDYADFWWNAVVEAVRSRGGPVPVRPVNLTIPFSPEARRLMLAPPSWIQVESDGSLRWQLPAHFNHPVTGVAFTDVLIFAAYVTERLGITFRLPTQAEFKRAYHGGSLWDPDTGDGNLWPWGSEEQPFWVNHLGFHGSLEPRLLDVNNPIGPPPDGIRALTREGLFHMAGNAREWTQPQELVRRRYQMPPEDGPQYFYWADNRLEFRAPVMGGSFKKGLGECLLSSVWYVPIGTREDDIGFRLAANRPIPISVGGTDRRGK